MCMPGIIGPKNATVPAWYGLPGSARVTPGGALTSTSNARVVDSPPGRGSVIAATSGRGCVAARCACTAARGTATRATFACTVACIRGTGAGAAATALLGAVGTTSSPEPGA